MVTIEEICNNFSFLEQWDDRYRYILDLGETLAVFPETDRTVDNKVQGCMSRVWVVAEQNALNQWYFKGDSDSQIVKGLIAILFAIYNGKNSQEILDCDTQAVLARLGLDRHLSGQRANGLQAMINRIKKEVCSS